MDKHILCTHIDVEGVMNLKYVRFDSRQYGRHIENLTGVDRTSNNCIQAYTLYPHIPRPDVLFYAYFTAAALFVEVMFLRPCGFGLVYFYDAAGLAGIEIYITFFFTLLFYFHGAPYDATIIGCILGMRMWRIFLLCYKPKVTYGCVAKAV